MRTRKNLLFHTFIGLLVEVTKSSDRNLTGMKGEIVGETKNLLIVNTKKNSKKIPKVSCTFRFFLESGEQADVLGKDILFRPEERPKKV